jgi:hypothetical protein
VHGPFNGSIVVDAENCGIIANGVFIKVIYGEGPDKIDYPAHGISNAIVIDNTGSWRDEAGLSLHLQSPGVSRVLLTAPGKGALRSIVYGINSADLVDEDKKLPSGAPCATDGRHSIRVFPGVIQAVRDQRAAVRKHCSPFLYGEYPTKPAANFPIPWDAQCADGPWSQPGSR